MSKPERLFHISDVHFGAEDTAALAQFAQIVAQEQPNGVVCTGDLTQRARHGQFAAAREYFAGLAAPVALAPGNHDMPYFNLWERFTRPNARSDALIAAVGAELELEQAVLVPLDTNVTAQARWPWSDGVIVARKLNDTLTTLARLSHDPRLKLVTCHHPLLPARDGETNPTIGGDEAFAALAEAGADAVLSGHVHVPFDLLRSRGGKSMRMIGAGTMSTRLRGAAASWNEIVIDGGEISVTQRGTAS